MVPSRPAFDECESNDSDVGNGDMAKSIYMLDICNFGPKVFNRVVKIPRVGQCDAVGFDFLRCHHHVAVRCLEMIKHAGTWEHGT